MWAYRSPIGTMSINKNLSGRYVLRFGEIEVGSWKTPEQAADDVCCHVTGIPEWDSMDGKVPNAPSGLAEWESV